MSDSFGFPRIYSDPIRYGFMVILDSFGFPEDLLGPQKLTDLGVLFLGYVGSFGFLRDFLGPQGLTGHGGPVSWLCG